MTVVNPKSISGINSITTGSGSDNLLTIHTSDASSTERVRINSSGDVIVGSGITVSPDGDVFTTGVTTATTFVGALTGNVTGNINGDLTGTLQTAAQTNITSVGSLSSLVVTGGITATGGNIVMNDSSGSSANRIKLGTSQDLELYHNGSNSMIEDNGTGNLEIRTNGTKVTLQGGNNPMINAIKDGAVEIYHNNEKKLYTYGEGVYVQDDSSAGAYLVIATNAGTQGSLYGTANTLGFLDGQNHYMLKGVKDGAVELYHNNNKSLETTADGGVKAQGNYIVGTSGRGLQFNASDSGSSEILDDYEEGTHTLSVNSNVSLNASYNVGEYTKIGNVVTFTFLFFVSSVSSTNTVTVSLPFANKSGSGSSRCDAIGSVMHNGVNTGSAGVVPYIGNGGSSVLFYNLSTNGSWAVLNNSDLNANDEMYVTITYRAA